MRYSIPETGRKVNFWKKACLHQQITPANRSTFKSCFAGQRYTEGCLKETSRGISVRNREMDKSGLQGSCRRLENETPVCSNCRAVLFRPNRLFHSFIFCCRSITPSAKNILLPMESVCGWSRRCIRIISHASLGFIFRESEGHTGSIEPSPKSCNRWPVSIRS